MHIAHIVSTYPPYKGGMGNVAARYASELMKKGHEIEVFSPRYRFHDPYEKNGEVTRVQPAFTYGNSAFVPQMYSLLDKAEILHLHYPFFGGAELVAWYKKRHPKKPLVISYHMDTVGSGALGAFFSLYKRTFMPFILKQADKIIVASEDYAKNSNLAPYFKKRDIIEIPFGISSDYKPKKKKESEVFEILFVATLDKAHYFKGLHNLIEAMSLLVHERKHGHAKRPVKLTIVGDGDMKSFYQDKVKEMKISKYVEFKGRVSDHELIKAYQDADVTVLPSTDKSEAFGLVLIESMACGTPVIASSLPGVRSVVDHQKTGYTVHPGDIADLTLALEMMVNDDKLHQEMSEASIKRVEEYYRWPKIISKLEGVYKELV